MAHQLPLEGIRVVDLTLWIQGPLASSILGDLGAEVIKLERPGEGDHARGAQSLFGLPLILPDGRSVMFELSNRNKKGVAVDLHQPKGQEVFRRLVERSDAMVTNLSASALRDLKADRETVLSYNPEIVYARSTGYGLRGPDAEDPCQDTTGMARSGFMFNNVPNGEPPRYPPGGLSDVLSGTLTAFGVVTALLGKARGGITDSVTCSQLQAMMWLQAHDIAMYTSIGRTFVPHDRTRVGNPLMNVYKCADGKWFASGLFVTDRFWPAFCECMEVQHIQHDPRFETEVMRSQHPAELIEVLDAAFIKRTRDEWVQRYKQWGLWGTVVNGIADLPDDPQVQANDYIVDLDNGMRLMGAPFEMEKSRPPLRRGAPALSQHSDEVLQEVCGYTMDEVLAMKAEEVVW